MRSTAMIAAALGLVACSAAMAAAGGRPDRPTHIPAPVRRARPAAAAAKPGPATRKTRPGRVRRAQALPAATAKARRQRVVRVHVSSIAPSYSTLFDLLRDTELVVIGTVGRDLRVSRIPVDDPNGRGVQVLWAFSVESYLLGSGPPVLRVCQYGGTLGDLTYVEDDEPRLVPGQRYLLCLKWPERWAGNPGYKIYDRGWERHYNGDLDDLRLVHTSRGGFRLDHGRVLALTDPLIPSIPAYWSYETVRTDWYPGMRDVIGSTEDEFVADVARTLKSVESLGEHRRDISPD